MGSAKGAVALMWVLLVTPSAAQGPGGGLAKTLSAFSALRGKGADTHSHKASDDVEASLPAEDTGPAGPVDPQALFKSVMGAFGGFDLSSMGISPDKIANLATSVAKTSLENTPAPTPPPTPPPAPTMPPAPPTPPPAAAAQATVTAGPTPAQAAALAAAEASARKSDEAALAAPLPALAAPATVPATVAAVPASVAAVSAAVPAVPSAFAVASGGSQAGLAQGLSVVRSSVDALISEVSSLAAPAASVASVTTSLQTRVGALEAEQASMQKTLNAQGTRIKAAEAATKDEMRRLGQAEARNAALKSDVAELQKKGVKKTSALLTMAQPAVVRSSEVKTFFHIKRKRE